ncbi:MAG: copper resistance protein NlpE [Treponema sp.]|jgi:hypothetical protein|nr:copper resistance protein NlpE [Treponema sp.]
MKRILLSLYWVTAALIILGQGSCRSKQEMVWYKSAGRNASDFHTSKISLDWDGVYTGTIPSASGLDIDVLIMLNFDGTYSLRRSPVDRPENVVNSTGTFKWDKYEEMIILKIKDWPPYYKPVTNKLIQLDADGKYFTGDLAGRYVLKKIAP